jgi:hypothetical protein
MDLADEQWAVSIADGSRHHVTLVDPTLDEAVTEHLPQKLIADQAFDSYELAGDKY